LGRVLLETHSRAASRAASRVVALIFWGNVLIQIADMALLAKGNLNAKEEKLI